MIVYLLTSSVIALGVVAITILIVRLAIKEWANDLVDTARTAITQLQDRQNALSDLVEKLDGYRHASVATLNHLEERLEAMESLPLSAARIDAIYERLSNVRGTLDNISMTLAELLDRVAELEKGREDTTPASNWEVE